MTKHSSCFTLKQKHGTETWHWIIAHQSGEKQSKFDPQPYLPGQHSNTPPISTVKIRRTSLNYLEKTKRYCWSRRQFPSHLTLHYPGIEDFFLTCRLIYTADIFITTADRIMREVYLSVLLRRRKRISILWWIRIWLWRLRGSWIRRLWRLRWLRRLWRNFRLQIKSSNNFVRFCPPTKLYSLFWALS